MNMLRCVIFLLPLCSHLFTSVHTQNVNDTDDTTTEATPVAASLTGDEDDYWTPWYNVDDPYGGSGDFETVNSITSRLGEDICPDTHYIGDAECALVKSKDNTVSDILRRKCTTDGLICLNRDQLDGVCDDYKIRFLCNANENEGAGSTGSTSGRRVTSSFDIRIYIILAAVPVVIFLLRICWSCTFERRRRRQRRQLRAIRQRHPENTIDPEVFMPPPSYQELFGNDGGPFSLSRRYSLCRKCKSSQCEIFRNRQISQQRDSVTNESERSESSSNPERQQDSSNTERPEVSSNPGRSEMSSNTVRSEVSSNPGRPELTSNPDRPEVSSNTVRPEVSSNPETVDRTRSRSSSSSRSSRSRSSTSSDDSSSLDSDRTSNTSFSSSDTDDQSRTNNPRINPVTVETAQCECPCHKNVTEVMSYDNPAYSPDVEFQGGRSRRLPGMHLSVFSLFRSPSESSITEPPPPTYTEALQILKKNQNGST